MTGGGMVGKEVGEMTDELNIQWKGRRVCGG